MSAPKPLLAVLQGERIDPPPVWLMRQAGRYLPEYRATRAAAGGFLNMVYAPETAAEITLQPLRRFPIDGAILFSDILVVPHALGQDLRFVEGEGPRLAPRLDEADAPLALKAAQFEPVYETVRQVRAALPERVTMLGFAGAPWTVATYMVAGEGERDPARRMAYAEPERFGRLIDLLVAATAQYLVGQIRAGAEAVQIFDSWSGALAADEYARWVIRPTAALVERVKAAAPGVPVIGFPRGAGAKILDYALGTGVDALGLDETIEPAWADAVLPRGLAVQGNIDNMALLAGGEALRGATARAMEAFRSRPHVVNLGHGVVPPTPVEHVAALVAQVKEGLR